jgi:hypothetical protein
MAALRARRRACDQHFDSGFGAAADSFKDSADALASADIATPNVNSNLPISFLYRHAIEMYLKSAALIFRRKFRRPYGDTPDTILPHMDNTPLSRLGGAAPDPYAKKPLSLRVLYNTDFDYKGYWTGLILDGKDGTTITVPWRVVQDHNARSMFLVFYIPSFPGDAEKVIGLCKFIAVHHAEILEKEKPHMAEQISPNPGDNSPVLIKDLVFTGAIYLYTADQLSTVQEADIIRLFESKNLSAVIRSEYYRTVHAQEDRVDPFHQR